MRTLSHTVKALCQANHQAPLIHAGDVALADPGIRAEVLRFAGESYKAALNADIIRADAKAPEEDRRRGGQVAELRLATSLATTAFLNSFGAERVVGASAAQLVIGVGRPGLSRGLIDDVRDSLEASLWYMRLEGGRYRFATEPNLNKVVLEREGAITDDRIEVLVREAIAAVARGSPVLRVEPRVEGSADLPDLAQLVLGVIDFRYRIGADGTGDTLRAAREILEHRGGSFRSNRNAAVLVAADGPAMAKARASARTLAALRDLKGDKHRLGRFNAEQREQLDKRLVGAEERLPQQVAMAYRHLLLLGESDGGGAELDHVDLGPARVDARIGDRVLEYLRGADRLVETTLAPAALARPPVRGSSPRGSTPSSSRRSWATSSACRASPSWPRRRCCASPWPPAWPRASSAWPAGRPGTPRRRPALRGHVDPGEIQFQPGTWLVRGTAVKAALAQRRAAEPDPAPGAVTAVTPAVPPLSGGQPVPGPAEPEAPGRPERPGSLRAVTVRIGGIPGSKAREVIKVAVLPLVAASSEVAVEITVHADGGLAGIPRETLSLVVLEGLRQLGLDDVDVKYE